MKKHRTTDWHDDRETFVKRPRYVNYERGITIAALIITAIIFYAIN